MSDLVNVHYHDGKARPEWVTEAHRVRCRDGNIYPAFGQVLWEWGPFTRNRDVITVGETLEALAASDVCGSHEPLHAILMEAYQQAAAGKGRERHARDKPFLRQPILEIGRMLSSADGEIFQGMKKAQEASGMVERGQPDRAVAELLGAINYLAAAVILIREQYPAEAKAS